MNKKLLVSGTIFCLVGVLLGAFGAHGLKTVLTVDQLATFETGVRYQMYHGIALLIVACVPILTDAVKQRLAWFFITGILLFSGSIYGLTGRHVFNFEASFLGPVTPVGGLLLICGWIFLLIYCIKYKSVKSES